MIAPPQMRIQGFVMAYSVIPTCKYEHGPLKPTVATLMSPMPVTGLPQTYFAPGVSPNGIHLGWGFIFEIWRCDRCSYLELHDFPATEEKPSPGPEHST